MKNLDKTLTHHIFTEEPWHRNAPLSKKADIV